MWCPMTYADWKPDAAFRRSLDREVPGWAAKNGCEAVRLNAEFLLTVLFVPSSETGAIVSKNATDALIPGVLKEPINWGDIAAHVTRQGRGWLVTLEEAQDGRCPRLCEYVCWWLERWGWKPVLVKTEW